MNDFVPNFGGLRARDPHYPKLPTSEKRKGKIEENWGKNILDNTQD